MKRLISAIANPTTMCALFTVNAGAQFWLGNKLAGAAFTTAAVFGIAAEAVKKYESLGNTEVQNNGATPTPPSNG